jgi:transcription elongation factor Elf1
MVTQSQSQNRPTNHEFFKCAMCPSEATKQCFDKDSRRIICVCDNCSLMLNHTNRLSTFEPEFNQYEADQIPV